MATGVRRDCSERGAGARRVVDQIGLDAFCCVTTALLFEDADRNDHAWHAQGGTFEETPGRFAVIEWLYDEEG